VTFRLNSLHGDADIYISRLNKNPSKYESEKSSVKSYDAADFIFFDGANISSTYFVSVGSAQYSTYNILV
jgi:hypothetical protein